MALISLNGDLIYSWEVNTDKRERGRYIPTTIARSVDQKLYELKQTKNRLIGIGIGAPGPINVEDGSIEVAVNSIASDEQEEIIREWNDITKNMQATLWYWICHYCLKIV